jgi:hypothetical protein
MGISPNIATIPIKKDYLIEVNYIDVPSRIRDEHQFIMVLLNINPI